MDSCTDCGGVAEDVEDLGDVNAIGRARKPPTCLPHPDLALAHTHRGEEEGRRREGGREGGRGEGGGGRGGGGEGGGGEGGRGEGGRGEGGRG